MKLFIDTNRIMAALIKEGPTRKLITSNDFELYAPQHTFEEIEKYKSYIIKKSGLSEKRVAGLLESVKRSVKFVNESVVRAKMKEAKGIMNEIDTKDSPILACALAINCGIWSEDKHFEKQNKVKVYKTKDLIKL